MQRFVTVTEVKNRNQSKNSFQNYLIEGLQAQQKLEFVF